jgi:hypothetical protein
MGGRALALARLFRAAYLMGMDFRVQALPPSDVLPSARRIPLALVGGIAVALMLLVAAASLWVAYGTTVFFEMIAAGIAACF